MGFGVSFIPNEQGGPDQNNQLGGAPSGVAPLQQAIQLLTLRLPRQVGAQGIAPGPLMQSPGGSAIANLLAQLFGQGHPSMGTPGMAPGMSAPVPNVKPGVESPGGISRPGPLTLPPPAPGGMEGYQPGRWNPGGYEPPPAPQAPMPQPRPGGFNREWNIGPRNY